MLVQMTFQVRMFLPHPLREISTKTCFNMKSIEGSRSEAARQVLSYHFPASILNAIKILKFKHCPLYFFLKFFSDIYEFSCNSCECFNVFICNFNSNCIFYIHFDTEIYHKITFSLLIYSCN